MKKAIATGMITGLIISAIMIGGTYIRRFLPHTFTANLLFLLFFFGSIGATLWFSLDYYCRSSRVKWKSLTFTGITSSVIAALLVTLHGYLYIRFSDPYYMDEIMQVSSQNWQVTKAAGTTLAGSLSWLGTPFDYAFYNFRDVIFLILVLYVATAAVFYWRNRKRQPSDRAPENHELIF